MLVKICALNSQYIHSSLAPWCLLAGVREYANTEKIHAEVVEGTVNEPEEAVYTRLLANAPQVISFCTYIWNVKTVFSLTKRIKEEHPEITLILGGPEVSYCAEIVLKEQPQIDFILSGEGEYPFAKLLTELSSETPEYKTVPGLCLKEANGAFYISEPYLPREDPVSPYCTEYFESLKGRIAYLETSRGCPYSCAFCLSGRCGGVRFFNIETAKENMLKLANSGAKTIKLVDRTFNADKKRAKELFSFIIEEHGKRVPEDVCFHFEIAGDILDESLLALLNSAPKGAIQLEIGLQSFNPQTLEAVTRKTNVARLTRNIQTLLKPRNVHVHIDLIAGLPYEGLESFKESFNHAYFLYPDMLQFGFLKLLYGAPMRENREKYLCTYSKDPPYEVEETPWLSKEDLKLLKRTEAAFDKLYNSGRFRRTIEFAIKKLEITPFDVFLKFAEYLEKTEGVEEHMPLDAYTNALFAFLSTFPEIQNMELRDAMLCDRLSTNSSNILPQSLKVKDSNLKKLRAYLNTNESTKLPLHGKRSVAILYGAEAVVYVDYKEADRVTGEYPLHILPFADFKNA